MENKRDLSALVEAFDFAGTNVSNEILLRGHINETYIVSNVSGGKPVRYILQRINTSIFKDPVGLMENVKSVTEHIRKVACEKGTDSHRCTLSIIPARDGKNYHFDDEGGCWRAYEYIEDSVSYDVASGPDLMYKAGKALGEFQQILADFPAETLNETIANFHNTVSRYSDFEKAACENAAGRASSVTAEIDFVKARKDFCGIIVNEILKGSVPVRVTHNDTKLNNILMDSKTDDILCFIDLDTVMPGSALYDFGDSIRFAASSAAEDEKDLSKVWMKLDYFEAYARGYLSRMAKVLTPAEIKLIPESCILLTLECGMRFLADYLAGDVYFGIHYPEHNLDRARTQLKLVADMEAKLPEMHRIIDEIVAAY